MIPRCDRECCVVEVCVVPARSGVTLRAVGRISHLYVIGVSCAVVILCVTGIAIRRWRSRVAVRVALSARDSGVCACQRETSRAMVKGRVIPIGCAMALSAIVREPELRMIRVRGVVVIGAVTRIAVRRRRSLVAVRMALGASHRCMRARQREACRVMVKCDIRPVGCIMALGTICRKALLDVIRICCVIEILAMARVTVSRWRSLVAVGVALGALNRRVSARKRETRGVVVERGIRPICGVMALGAVCWEPELSMARVCR